MSGSPRRLLERAAQRQQARIDQQEGPRMIIDVTGPVTDYKGEPLTVPDATVTDGQPGTRDLLFRDILVDAINSTRPNVEVPPADKIRAYRLSVLIFEKDKVELTSEDVVFLKKAAGENLTPLGAGRVHDLLDPVAESHGVDEGDDDA